MKQALIYNELVRFYNRSRRKLHTLVVEGKNLRKQSILQRRIARLFKTLMGFQRALKLGIATAATSTVMLLFQPNATQAQISFSAAQLNPFGITNVFTATPALIDLDSDGDMDLIAGTYSADFIYFQNTGTAVAPAFGAGQTNPFGLTRIGSYEYYYYGYYSSVAFADLDGDGDIDLMAGDNYGNFFYYQNTGIAVAPAFAAPLLNPLGLTNVGGSFSTPAFVDLDEDGDMDMMAGKGDGNFIYFENTGTSTAPAFAAAQSNPFGLTDVGVVSAPAFTDLDADGDVDLISGEAFGNFIYFQNTGTAAAPVFAAAQTNPFGLTAIGYGWSHLSLSDLDGDGDIDMMAADYDGTFYYFENTTACNGLTVYADADGDHYGDAANSLFVADCIVPSGYVISNLDCDDNNTGIHPGACDASNGNGIDDNCDGVIDNGFGATTYYTDADGDGFGTGTGTSLCSDPGAGYSIDNTDCDDSNINVRPGACDAANGDGVDDNCDGVIDDGFGATTYYTDADGDGYGTGTGSSLCSNPGTGYSTNSSDCDDGNASVHPGAIEIVNGMDDNCNGIIDDVIGCPLPANRSVTKITGTSAKLKWDAVAGAEGYTVRYKVENVSGWKYGTTHNPSKPISALLPNTVYKWEVRTYCHIDLPYVTSDWSSKQEFTTGSLRMGDESLQQVSFHIYPNPAEDHATIQFTLLQSSHVYIKVYDVSGKKIATLLDEDIEQGNHSLLFSANHFSKGVYLIKMIADFGIDNQKLIVQ